MKPIRVEYDSDRRFLRMIHYRTHLRALRQVLGQSQRQFAETFGINRSTLANWEALHHPPNPRYRTWLAQFVGVLGDRVQQPGHPWEVQQGKKLRTYEEAGREAPPF